MNFWKKKSKKNSTELVPKIQSKPDSKDNHALNYNRVEQMHQLPISNKMESRDNLKAKINPEKEFLKIFKELTASHRSWDVWSDFIIMAACSFSNAVDKSHYKEREERYLQIIKKYNKEEQQLFPALLAMTVLALEENPEQDFLGHIFIMLDFADRWKQQQFTPYHICELMAQISMDNVVEQVRENGYFTIGDPCCGAGATLIAGIHAAKKKLQKAGINYQNHILVAAQDIDETVALMCYIQLSLLGVAAYVKIGNSLTNPISEYDTTENYWFTPIYFSDIWSLRRIFKNFETLFEKGKDDV